MATLRNDVFTKRKPKGERGRGSFYGNNVHTGIKMGCQDTFFSAPINDIYGTHVVFGDEAERKIRKKPED